MASHGLAEHPNGLREPHHARVFAPTSSGSSTPRPAQRALFEPTGAGKDLRTEDEDAMALMSQQAQVAIQFFQYKAEREKVRLAELQADMGNRKPSRHAEVDHTDEDADWAEVKGERETERMYFDEPSPDRREWRNPAWSDDPSVRRFDARDEDVQCRNLPRRDFEPADEQRNTRGPGRNGPRHGNQDDDRYGERPVHWSGVNQSTKVHWAQSDRRDCSAHRGRDVAHDNRPRQYDQDAEKEYYNNSSGYASYIEPESSNASESGQRYQSEDARWRPDQKQTQVSQCCHVHDSNNDRRWRIFDDDERSQADGVIPLCLPAHKKIHPAEELGTYIGAAEYFVALQGTQPRPHKYGVIIVPVGDEKVLFRDDGIARRDRRDSDDDQSCHWPRNVADRSEQHWHGRPLEMRRRRENSGFVTDDSRW